MNCKNSLPDRHNLAKRHVDPPELGDEDGRHGLVQRRAVHVDGGSDGDHEAGDARVQPHVVAAPDRDGHRR